MEQDSTVFWPEERFHKRLEFEGRLIAGDKTLEDLHIIVQYSLLDNAQIKAIVIGNNDTFASLVEFMGLPVPTYSIRLTCKTNDLDEIISDEVYIEHVHGRSVSEGIRFIVGELIFYSLTVKRKFVQIDQPERHLTFYLCGPRQLWPSYGVLSKSFMGEVKYEVENSSLDIAPDLPYTVEVRPVFFFEHDTEGHNDITTRDVYALHLATTNPESELPDAEYVKRGISLADDLTLLVSFVARNWITWFSYSIQTATGITTLIRATRECREMRIDTNYLPIPLHRVSAFLKTAVSMLRELKSSGVDLSMPIAYVVNGNQLKYIQERFSVFFMALEILKDYYATGKNLYCILSKDDFRTLRVKLIPFIEKQVASKLDSSKICGKLGELNRESLRSLLDIMFKQYDVSWEDLYPAKSKFSLIDTRNNLFHTGKQFDLQFLSKEELRLRSILERLILKMLGWHEHPYAPHDAIRLWLIS
ncbi:MAG: hypothetical protein NT002_00570 [candidate division Zixibacteria bacterium]|nr:hypothetical protein [candidate division Zixibacteria bacterium]